MTDTEKRDAWIIDVDGTLAHNTSGRSPYDNASYDEVLSDELDPVVGGLVSLLAYSGGFDIIICSGRSERHRTVTQDWLFKHGIPHVNLFMRAEGDYRKDSIVKLELLDKYILPTWNVVGVLDDRNQVVEAWRSRGLKCLQVAEGNF
jgi:hypothetical protein